MHNLQNEYIILDCCIMSPTLLPVVIDNVKATDFYEPMHQELFAVIKELFEQNIKVSLSSITSRASDKKLSVQFGNILKSWSGENILPFIENLQDDSNRRQINYLLQEQKELIENKNYTLESLTTEIDTKLRSITANKISPVTMLTEMHTDDIYDLGSNKKAKKTGFTELDRMMWGISGGELVILAALTSQGKSSAVGNIGTYIAEHYMDDNVLWFSLEMPKEQMRRRFVAQYAEYDNFKIKIKKYENNEDIEKVRQAMNKVDALPIGIVDRKFEISEIVSIARRFSHGHRISVIIVDYLQQISNYIAGANTATQVGDSIKKLKDIAMELNVPLICLSQFSRKSEREEFPDLSWLKESSTIEQAADMVWFLHRYTDKQKEKLEDEYLHSVQNLYRFIVAKNRDGKANFHIEMEFVPEYTQFKCI